MTRKRSPPHWPVVDQWPLDSPRQWRVMPDFDVYVVVNLDKRLKKNGPVAGDLGHDSMKHVLYLCYQFLWIRLPTQRTNDAIITSSLRKKTSRCRFDVIMMLLLRHVSSRIFWGVVLLALSRVSARQGSMHFCPIKISRGSHFMSPRDPKTLEESMPLQYERTQICVRGVQIKDSVGSQEPKMTSFWLKTWLKMKYDCPTANGGILGSVSI